MEAAIHAYLRSVSDLCPEVSIEALNFLASELTITELNKKDIYLEAGKVQKDIGYVFRGLIRGYYIDAKGNEFTVNLLPESLYACHYSSFLSQSPSKYYFQALEPSIVVNIPFEHMNETYEEHPDLERYGRRIAEEVLKRQQKRIESLLFQNDASRYFDFKHDNPKLISRLSVAEIASYLGIEPGSLSTIQLENSH